MDSVKIIYNIEKLKNNKDKFLLGDTGYLQLDEFNKIRRHLIIVEFKNGKTKKFPFKKMLEKKHIKFLRIFFQKIMSIVSQVIVGLMVTIIVKSHVCQNVSYLLKIKLKCNKL